MQSRTVPGHDRCQGTAATAYHSVRQSTTLATGQPTNDHARA